MIPARLLVRPWDPADRRSFAPGSAWEARAGTFELGGALLQVALVEARREGLATLLVAERPARYHARCRRCKRTVTALIEERVAAGWDDRRGRRYVRRDPVDLDDPNRSATATACPGCRGTLRLARVKGTPSASVPCDARCTGARGPNCECSCGGANHGADWGIG